MEIQSPKAEKNETSIIKSCIGSKYRYIWAHSQGECSSKFLNVLTGKINFLNRRTSRLLASDSWTAPMN